ncbi:MAG TPA: threonine/serine dehydratase [Pyrinomonadaceae bacterium]|nr:threonine/serine dehydratase [Pyrinomonadaceae bacterium]
MRIDTRVGNGHAERMHSNVFRPTTIIEPARLGERVGVRLVLASEAFQHTGSFKFRAGYNVAANVPNDLIIAASSGNFGQGLAYACKLLKKRCIIVMPATSDPAKVAAVREHGAKVDMIDVGKMSRAERVTQLCRENPDAYMASAYDDPLVIQGNATLGRELAGLNLKVDCFVAPVGGGGLTSGLITGLRAGKCVTPVIGVEPTIANDAARSLREGKLVRNDTEPQTLADGVRTVSVGDHNWAILRDGLASIVEVDEPLIPEAMRLLFNLANLKAEPTGALAIAALLAQPKTFAGKSVCCVISGGNVDPALFAKIISE